MQRTSCFFLFFLIATTTVVYSQKIAFTFEDMRSKTVSFELKINSKDKDVEYKLYRSDNKCYFSQQESSLVTTEISEAEYQQVRTYILSIKFNEDLFAQQGVLLKTNQKSGHRKVPFKDYLTALLKEIQVPPMSVRKLLKNLDDWRPTRPLSLYARQNLTLILREYLHNRSKMETKFEKLLSSSDSQTDSEEKNFKVEIAILHYKANTPLRDVIIRLIKLNRLRGECNGKILVAFKKMTADVFSRN